VQVHGNMWHALCALGGSAASVWHGRGALHSRAWAKLARGIGQGCRRRAGGKVTAREMDGGALPRFGALGGHGDALGECGVVEWCLCEVGSVKRASRDDVHSLGVGIGVGGQKQRRGRGFWQGGSLGLPPLPRVQLKNDKKKNLPRSPRLQRGRGNADLLPSPWSACKIRKREREENRQG
jgi:hypothetical protein